MVEREETCPFCKVGKVQIYHHPSSILKKKGTWGGSRPGIIRSEEVFEVLTDCPNCGKGKKQIKRELDGNVQKKSHEERIARLKASGFDGKIVNVRQNI